MCIHRLGTRTVLIALAATLGACQDEENTGDDGGADDAADGADDGADGADDGADGADGGMDGGADDGADDGGMDDGADDGGMMGTGCEGVVGEGYADGVIAQNFTLVDGAGNDVSLYDFCGKVIYFEDGAEW